MFFLCLTVAIVVFVVLRMGGDAVGPLPCPGLVELCVWCCARGYETQPPFYARDMQRGAA